MTEETTTEQLVEIEGQAAEYTPPEGWRVLQVGERLRDGDMIVRKDGSRYPAERLGGWVGSNQRHIRPIEPQPQPEPEPVQAREGRWRTRNGEIKDIRPCEPLKGAYYVWPWTDGFMTYQDNGLHQGSKESPNDLIEYLGPIEQQPQPQPIQVREGRWRTRGGEIRNVTPTPEDDDRVTQYPWYDAEYDQTWASNGRCYLDEEIQRDLVQYVGPIEPEPEPEKVIAPDDVAGQALAGVWDWANAERTIAELLGQLGEAKRRVVELETLVTDLRAVNAAQEKAANSEAREKADLQHRLDVVSKEWAEQAATINGLQAQLEGVKAELVQERLDRNRWHNQVLRVTAELDDKTTECRNLRIELDALQQAPQAETVAPQAVSERWEESYNKGAAQAVETIAEWTAPFRTCGSQGLSYHVMQNLPHIMRSLTGLIEED